MEYPVFWTTEEFCDGFLKLIDHLELDKVNLHNCLHNLTKYIAAWYQLLVL